MSFVSPAGPLVSLRTLIIALWQSMPLANGTAVPALILSRFIGMVTAPIATDAVISSVFFSNDPAFFCHFHDLLPLYREMRT